MLQKFKLELILLQIKSITKQTTAIGCLEQPCDLRDLGEGENYRQLEKPRGWTEDG
jgi:hypothetical protein